MSMQRLPRFQDAGKKSQQKTLTKMISFLLATLSASLLLNASRGQKSVAGFMMRLFYAWTKCNMPQGIVLIKQNGAIFYKNQDKYLKISHLVTHPHNIRSPVNEHDFSRVRGTGAFLVKEVAKKCFAHQLKGIYAEVTASSKSFYEKLGFEEIPREEVIIMDGDYPMVLQGEQMRKLLV